MSRVGQGSSQIGESTKLTSPQTQLSYSEKLIATRTYSSRDTTYINGSDYTIKGSKETDDTFSRPSISRKISSFKLYESNSEQSSFTIFYKNLMKKEKKYSEKSIKDEILNWIKQRYDETDNVEHLPNGQYGGPNLDYCPWPLEKLSSSSTKLSCDPVELERTIILVKPNAMQYKDVILKTVFDHGFQIVNQRIVHLSPEQGTELYSKYYGSPSFPCLVRAVSEKPILVLSIAAINAVRKWKKIVGNQNNIRREWFFPFSMRKTFGIVDDIPDALYSSEDAPSAIRANRFFFSNSLLDPIKHDLLKVTDYCNLYINKTLTKGLSILILKKPHDPVLFLAQWLLEHNPFSPRIGAPVN